MCARPHARNIVANALTVRGPYLISSHLLFFKNSKCQTQLCRLQSSYTYRYNKMLRRQIVNNNNDIGSYKTQLCLQFTAVHSSTVCKVHTHVRTIKRYGDKSIDKCIRVCLSVSGCRTQPPQAPPLVLPSRKLD